jgi:uncharacterized RDD family membrane protein YckC
VLPSSVRACNFCDSAIGQQVSSYEDSSTPVISQHNRLDQQCAATNGASVDPVDPSIGPLIIAQDDSATAWRGELSVRMEAYRARKRRRPVNSTQSRLPFEHGGTPTHANAAAVSADSDTSGDFSFTIAIGRNAATREKPDGRMEIDVTLPPEPVTDGVKKREQATIEESYGAYPVASLEERRFAAAIDIGCLLFAYGGFLALFGSMGGQFTLSKLSAAVYGVTFAIVYLQYFALFTIFGGTTPGMMFRGLQVASFTGDSPTPRQMLLRSLGYILSAGTFCLGFLWAWWDADALTWHDRLSQTYLSVLQNHEDLKTSAMAPSHGR